MFFNRNKLSILFSHSVIREDKLFADIYGCDDIKKLFRMALESSHTCSILLIGPPASSKTLFLQSLMKLKDSHFIDCSTATKSGIVDYVFDNKPKYLLMDDLSSLFYITQHFRKKPVVFISTEKLSGLFWASQCVAVYNLAGGI